MKLRFEPVSLEMREALLPYYRRFGGGSCQHSFVSSFCMREKYGDEVCVRDHFLYTHRSGLSRGSERVYLFPLGDPSSEDAVMAAVENVLADAHACGCSARFETVTGEAAALLERLLPGRFAVEERRDLAEYLYTRDRLALLPGHDMASKRHDLSTFERDFAGRFEVRKITDPAQLDEIRPFQAWWKQARVHREEDVQLELEDRAIRVGLDHFFDLGLSGIILRIDGRLAGYAYGAPLSDSCYDVMIEKGDRRAADVYKVLNRDLVRLCCDGAAWINREEDLGVPGLRQAKMSYRPDLLLKKYSAREVTEP